jgi:DNA-binding NarL/FixJ family response regulator
MISLPPVRLILVEDHCIVCAGLRKIVETCPEIEVVAAAQDGKSAIDAALTYTPDIILMDIHLEKESGIVIGARILRELPGIKLIALSCDRAAPTIAKAIQTGFSGYIYKGSNLEELLEGIQAVRNGQLFLSRNIAADVTQYLLQTTFGNESGAAHTRLTEREIQLIRHISEGRRNKEIADLMQINIRSVETYRTRLLKKLNCSSTAEMIRLAIREGVIKP